MIGSEFVFVAVSVGAGLADKAGKAISVDQVGVDLGTVSGASRAQRHLPCCDRGAESRTQSGDVVAYEAAGTVRWVAAPCLLDDSHTWDGLAGLQHQDGENAAGLHAAEI